MHELGRTIGIVPFALAAFDQFGVQRSSNLGISVRHGRVHRSGKREERTKLLAVLAENRADVLCERRERERRKKLKDKYTINEEKNTRSVLAISKIGLRKW